MALLGIAAFIYDRKTTNYCVHLEKKQKLLLNKMKSIIKITFVRKVYISYNLRKKLATLTQKTVTKK